MVIWVYYRILTFKTDIPMWSWNINIYINVCKTWIQREKKKSLTCIKKKLRSVFPRLARACSPARTTGVCRHTPTLLVKLKSLNLYFFRLSVHFFPPYGEKQSRWHGNKRSGTRQMTYSPSESRAAFRCLKTQWVFFSTTVEKKNLRSASNASYFQSYTKWYAYSFTRFKNK